MTWLQYGLTTLFTVSVASSGNFYLQKRLISIKNKEKAINFIVDMIVDLNGLYFKYWNENIHCEQTSLKIKIEQTRLIGFLNFTYNKYNLTDKQTNTTLLTILITEATNEDFDSKSRSEKNQKKSIEASKNCNNLIQNLFKNKI